MVSPLGCKNVPSPSNHSTQIHTLGSLLVMDGGGVSVVMKDQ